MSDVALTASIDLPAGSLGRRGVGWWGLVCAIAGEAALFGYLLFAYYYCRVEIGPDWIPLWWDILAVALFSLVIYFWAMAVALPTERIEEMIGDVVLPEEEGITPEAAPAPADEPLTRGT